MEYEGQQKVDKVGKNGQKWSGMVENGIRSARLEDVPRLVEMGLEAVEFTPRHNRIAWDHIQTSATTGKVAKFYKRVGYTRIEMGF